MSFHVGQKVEYVGGLRETWGEFFYSILHPYRSPKKRTPYTVSNVHTGFDGLAIELFELPAPETKYWAAGYLAAAFRPIVSNERKTDISVFKKLLVPGTKVLETVR